MPKRDGGDADLQEFLDLHDERMRLAEESSQRFREILAEQGRRDAELKHVPFETRDVLIEMRKDSAKLLKLTALLLVMTAAILLLTAWLLLAG
jgi:hypothetical protein